MWYNIYVRWLKNMTVKRLIELLQQADPDGNKEVVISDEHNYTPDGVEEYGD